LSEQGYALRSIHSQVSLAALFQPMAETGTELSWMQSTSDHPSRYLQIPRSAGASVSGRCSFAQLRFSMFCVGTTCFPPKKILPRRLTSAERNTQAYEQHLLDARGLARATIINYVPFVRRFLQDRFGDGPVIPSHLSASDIVSFVRRQAPHLHPKRAKLLTTALRSFLPSNLRYRGSIKQNLDAAVPAVANWSMSSIPRGIASDQVRRLLDSIDQYSVGGRRDYAILLLLARLGCAQAK